MIFFDVTINYRIFNVISNETTNSVGRITVEADGATEAANKALATLGAMTGEHYVLGLVLSVAIAHRVPTPTAES